MKEVSVFHGTGNLHRAALQGALAKTKNRPTGIYRMQVVGPVSYVFTTTSKDVHLWLGILGTETLRLFGWFLGEEFKGGGTELLLSIESLSRNQRLLVTVTKPEEQVLNFTLSPAH